MQSIAKCVTTGLLAVGSAAQQHLVVPQAYDTVDAPAYGWVAGASRDVRQQTLIGASHLSALVGKAITAIRLRRHAANEHYLGGVANLTVNLSTAHNTPLDCSNVFAANASAPAQPNFSGQVTLPTSPATSSQSVPWSPDNVIHIQLANPFTYTGGTLCVDVTGHPVSGLNADWWMADLALEDISGTTNNLGGGCGIYGGANKEWSHASWRSLIAGGYARFFANGTPNGLALAAFGPSSPSGVPLAVTGLPAASGCDLWLSSVQAILPTIFAPPQEPADLPFGGEAEVQFKLPNSATVLGVSMTTQWIDWSQMATSNAIEWTVSPSTPTLDMALIEGAAGDPTGLAAPYMGHVFRFEYQ